MCLIVFEGHLSIGKVAFLLAGKRNLQMTWLQAVAAGWSFQRCALQFGLPYAEGHREYIRAQRVLALGEDRRMGRHPRSRRAALTIAAKQAGAELREVPVGIVTRAAQPGRPGTPAEPALTHVTAFRHLYVAPRSQRADKDLRARDLMPG